MCPRTRDEGVREEKRAAGSEAGEGKRAGHGRRGGGKRDRKIETKDASCLL